MKSRIPQPKLNLEALRWKTKLNVPLAKKLDGTPVKIHIAEKSNHVFFHDESKGNDVSTDITGKIWGYGFDPNDVSSPGPTLEAIENETVNIEWVNSLPRQVHHPFVEPPRELRSPGMMSRYDVGHTVVHLHGAHAPWISDGYSMRVSKGMGKNPLNKKTVLRPGQSEIFEYPNTQPGGATLWYHDHTMDMTSMNVYAGLAGAYLLRHQDEHKLASLPKEEYEIPLIIQDRSFVEPDTRIEDDTDNLKMLYGDATFLSQYLGSDLTNRLIDRPQFLIDLKNIRDKFFYGTDLLPSPEFKGQVICVNGKIWPFLEIEPRPYRFRIVNGSNSRMYVLRISNATLGNPDIDSPTTDIPICQIGSDGGLFKSAVELNGKKTNPLQPDGTTPTKAESANFLVLAPGERADVIIDFSGRNLGDIFYLTNHAEDIPDSPLGNGGDKPISGLTDGILKFVVKTIVKPNLNSPLIFDLIQLNTDLGRIGFQPNLVPDPTTLLNPTRRYVIQEYGPIPLTSEEASKVTHLLPDGKTNAIQKGWKAITFQPNIPADINDDNLDVPGFLWAGSPPFDSNAQPNNQLPEYGAVPNGGPFADSGIKHQLGSKVELWEFYNKSPDVHPIHLHHSGMQLYDRSPLDPMADPVSIDQNEKGLKDTIRVNPKQRTRIVVRFDNGDDNTRPADYYKGHYVWHCHILEHEDMGMMRPLEIE
jgi:spore coat protein A, manganese oxidase